MTRLTNIAIHHPGPSVEIGFEWDEVIRYNETVLWSLFARDQRDQTRQFGYKLIGDKPVQFVFNHNRGLQSNTPVSASLGFREGYLQCQGDARFRVGARGRRRGHVEWTSVPGELR